MTQELPPPPLPQTSSKRILPAFLLCFTICAHRIYAGKIISGIVQMVWVIGASVWAYASVKGLMAIVNSGSLDEGTLDKISEWQETHGDVSRLPMLLLIAVGFWVAIDAGRLLRGTFTDGQGNKITRWF